MSNAAMGFDYGTTKIGIAVGQAVTRTATPVAIVKARDGIPDWQAVDLLVEEWQPDIFIVGLPLNMDDTESEMSVRAEKFARRLNGRYNIPFVMVDERLSSFDAEQLMGKDEPVDAMAASLILETWLNQRYSSSELSSDKP